MAKIENKFAYFVDMDVCTTRGTIPVTSERHIYQLDPPLEIEQKYLRVLYGGHRYINWVRIAMNYTDDNRLWVVTYPLFRQRTNVLEQEETKKYYKFVTSGMVDLLKNMGIYNIPQNHMEALQLLGYEVV